MPRKIGPRQKAFMLRKESCPNWKVSTASLIGSNYRQIAENCQGVSAKPTEVGLEAH